MAQITVTVAGRTYRMGCDEGQEAHLEALAHAFDAKIGEFRDTVGDIGEMRLLVMAGLYFVDEMAELKRRLLTLEDARNTARDAAQHASRSADAAEHRIGVALDQAAKRLEALARTLAAPDSERD